MATKLLLTAATVVGLSAVGVIAGCSSTSSDSSNNNGDASASSSGGSTSSSSSSGGSSSGSSGTNPLLISNMATGTNGPINWKPPSPFVSGYWFDDVNNVNTADLITAPASCTGATSATCAGCGNFAFSPLATSIPQDATIKNAAHITCTLTTLYAGCEMDLQFALLPVDAGYTVPYNGCSTTSEVEAVDISAYTGIHFWAMMGSTDSAYAHEVKLPDVDTDPHGGTCTESDGGTVNCYNHFQTSILFGTTPGTWGENTWHYSPAATSDFVTEPGWGVQGLVFNPQKVYGINFQAKGPQQGPDAGGMTETADFWIADISFVNQ